MPSVSSEAGLLATAGPALAGLELDTIARGLQTADELVKEAPVTLIAATPSTPGRFLVVFAGEEAAVTYAIRRGRDVAGAHLVDELLLTQVDEQVVPAMAAVRPPDDPDAIGILETHTALAAVLVADGAAKAAHVRVIQIVVSRGLHGKGFVTLGGTVGDVTEALAAGEALVAGHGGLACQALLARPDPTLAARVYAGDWGLLAGRPLY